MTMSHAQPDRDARDAALDAMDRLLRGKSSLENLNSAVFDIEQTTDDPLIGYVGSCLFEIGEEMNRNQTASETTNETGVCDRATWNYLWRLKLLLESDAEMDTLPQKNWTYSQSLALFFFGVGLFGSISLMLLTANGAGWWTAIWILFNFFGLLILRFVESRYNRFARRIVEQTNPPPSRMPFSSFAELLAVRRSVTRFRKQPFRPIRLKEPDTAHGVFLSSFLGNLAGGQFFSIFGLVRFLLWFAFLMEYFGPVHTTEISFHPPYRSRKTNRST